MHRASPRGGLWRHREFLLLWGAQGISAVGSRVTRTALPIAAILVTGAGAIGMRPTLWVLAFGVAVAALALITVRRALPGAGAR